MFVRFAVFSRNLLSFRRAHEGAVAVEFALAVGPLLFAILFLVDMAANAIVFSVLTKATARTRDTLACSR
jgi:Flp pilus assembly protein TadG